MDLQRLVPVVNCRWAPQVYIDSAPFDALSFLGWEKSIFLSAALLEHLTSVTVFAQVLNILSESRPCVQGS